MDKLRTLLNKWASTGLSKNTYKNKGDGLTSALWTEDAIHPGVWFAETYPNLTESEKMVWIDLLTLALASYPTGRFGFCSYSQVAATLSLDDESFWCALQKAHTCSLVEVQEKAIVPTSLDYGDEWIRENPDEKKYGVRYKEMVFPGLYTYRWDGTVSLIAAQSVYGRSKSEAEREAWDAALEGPHKLLRRIMRHGLARNLSPFITKMSPIGPWTKSPLPMSTQLVPDRFDIEGIVAGYKGLALWKEDPVGIDRAVRLAWRELESWIEGRCVREKNPANGLPGRPSSALNLNDGVKQRIVALMPIWPRTFLRTKDKIALPIWHTQSLPSV